jgi:hypothetical protein
MFAKIVCPSCQALGQFSVIDGNYKGPYRCWKCRALFDVEIVNAQMISCKAMTEVDLEELKAKEEAEKKNHVVNVKPPSASESAPKTEPEPFVWPKVKDKIVQQDVEMPAAPKQPVIWPTTRRKEPDIAAPSSSPQAASKKDLDLPSEKPGRGNHGIILFQTMDTLVEAEKLLNDEGCTITRVPAPADPPGGSTVALRFHWEQYETVKSALGRAGVKTLEIRRLAS